MNRGPFSALLLCTVVSLSVVPTATLGVTYQFTRLVDTSGPYQMLGNGPAINNLGTVAFQAVLDDSTQTAGMCIGGNVVIVADPEDYLTVEPRVTIDRSANLMAFKALTFRTIGIYRGSGGSVTPIAEMGRTFAGINAVPSMGSAGAAVFFGTLQPANEGVFRTEGGPCTTIADNLSMYTDFGMNPALNDTGMAAFVATRADTGPGVFRGDGGPVTVIATTNGPYSMFGGTLAINHAGHVAFRASLDAGGQQMLVSNGATTVVVADTAGAYAQFMVPSINRAGRIAFRATLDNGEMGIYTGSDPTTSRVIKAGDMLDGSPVVGLQLFHEGLNDSGQIAFHAILGGQQAIYRATPIVNCPADVNHSGDVNIDDLVTVITQWGQCVACSGDVNLTGDVDIDDLVLIITAWGVCP